MKQKLYILGAIIVCMLATTLTYSHAAERRRKMAKTPSVELIKGHTYDRKPSLLPTTSKTQKRQNPASKKIRNKINSSGSTILAYRISPQPLGLIDINFNGTEQLLWEGSEYWFPTTGFIYDGHIYGINAFYFYGTMYVSRMDYDIETGEITYAEDMDENPAHAAITAAYDPTLNTAYAFTYTEDIDGYMFNSLDPESFTFTPINKDVDQKDICLAMAFDETRDALIGITQDGRLVEIDTRTGTNTTLANLPIQPAFYNTSMAYSPIDNAYVAQIIEDTGESCILKINADSYETEKAVCWDPDNIRQYMMMFSSDDVYNKEVPAAPTVKEIDVKGADLSGSIIFTLPSATIDGRAINGTLDFKLSVDGTPYAALTGLKAGDEVAIDLKDMREGSIVFSARATLDGIPGKTLKFKRHFGFDTPKAPTNVTINGKTGQWDHVTEGIEGGYVENIEYDVYLNGKLTGHTAENSMELEIPDNFSFNTLQVEAISHEKRSKRGSSEVVAGGLVTLGYTLLPEDREWAAFTVIDADNDGNTWHFDDWYGIAYETDEFAEPAKADDWLITPAYRITDTSVRHCLTFAIATETPHPIELEVLCGTASDLESMNQIDILQIGGTRTEKEININLSTDGPLYIAFHLLDTGRVFISNITLSQTEAKLTAPDNVKHISVVPAELGEEKATVSFTLPTTTINGETLTDNVEVKVTSELESIKLSGAPGQTMSAEINVPSGISRLALQTKEGSIVYSDEFFAGIDLPVAPAEIRSSVAEDNMEVTLSWEAPTEGIHAGWIDPASLRYKIQVFYEDEGWIELEDALEATTFIYRLDDGAPQDAWYYAVTPCNSAGESEDIAMTAVSMGTPYSLPISDYMMMGGNLKPLMTSGDEGYGGSWAFSYPGYFEEDAEDVQDFVVVGTNNSGEPIKGSMILPRFYPRGGERVGGYFRFFFGERTPDIDLVVYDSDGVKTVFAEIKAKEMPRGYQFVPVTLPESVNDKTWAQVAVEPVYDGTSQALIFVEYSLFAAYAKDMAAISLDGPRTIMLGEDKSYTLTVRNDGYSPITMPESSAEIVAEGRTIATASPVDYEGGKTLNPGEQVNVKFIFNIENPEALGAAELKARIATPDSNSANDEASMTITISAGSQPVVTDLKAADNGNGNILLTWTQPNIEARTEGFEDCEPFSVVSEIGEFTNVDVDAEYTVGYCFPYHTPEYNPTGWVVWDWNEIDKAPYNNYYKPFGGERMLVALCPDYTIDADDWLISPSVAGGSEVSFMMAACMMGVPEQLQIMVSETGNAISDFTMLDKIIYYFEDWEEYSITLPENAKYFAIRYTSNNGSAIFIDDLSYTPALANAKYSGYDIYRDGQLIAENTAQGCIYEDFDNDGLTNLYRVRPVYTLDSEEHRGLLSNTASASESGVNSIEGKDCKVYAEDGMAVIVDGKGSHVSVVSGDGIVITTTVLTSDEERIELMPGVNIVNVDGKTWKFIR